MTYLPTPMRVTMIPMWWGAAALVIMAMPSSSAGSSSSALETLPSTIPGSRSPSLVLDISEGLVDSFVFTVWLTAIPCRSLWLGEPHNFGDWKLCDGGADPEGVFAGFVGPSVVPVRQQTGGDLQSRGYSFAGLGPEGCGGDEPADRAFDGGVLLFGVDLDHLLAAPFAFVGEGDADQDGLARGEGAVGSV